MKKENHKLKSTLERKGKVEHELNSDLNDLVEENRLLQLERDEALDKLDKLKLSIESGDGKRNGGDGGEWNEEDSQYQLKIEEITTHVANLEQEIIKLHTF